MDYYQLDTSDPDPLSSDIVYLAISDTRRGVAGYLVNRTEPARTEFLLVLECGIIVSRIIKSLGSHGSCLYCDVFSSLRKTTCSKGPRDPWGCFLFCLWIAALLLNHAHH